MINDYYRNLPKKRMASGALFFNEKDEILLVKPNYKNNWLIPGGVTEDNESPKESCRREVEEEINLNIAIGRLLCVDYTEPTKEKSESLQFIFYGGVLNSDQVKNIKINFREIYEFKFFKIDEAIPLLSETLGKRVAKSVKALKNNSEVYLENQN